MNNTIYASIDENHGYNCKDDVLGRTGENFISVLEITIPPKLCHLWPYLDFKKPNGNTMRSERLEIKDGKITYDIPMSLLDETGYLEVQVILQGEDGEIWKSESQRYYVTKSIDAVDDIPEKKDFISQAQKLFDEVKSIADNANKNSATFIPFVSSDGILSWTNNKGLENPAPVKIVGNNGYTPQKGIDYFTEADKAELVAMVMEIIKPSGRTLTVNTTSFSNSHYTRISLYVNGEKQYTTEAYSAFSDSRVYENVTEAYLVLEESAWGGNDPLTEVNGVLAWPNGTENGARFDLLGLGTDTITIQTDWND